MGEISLLCNSSLPCDETPCALTFASCRRGVARKVLKASLSGTGGVVNNVGAGVICTTGILDPVLRGTCQGADVWGTGGVVPGNKLGKLPTIGVLRATTLGVKGSDATGATGATMGSTSGVGGRGVVARLVAEGEVNSM